MPRPTIKDVSNLAGVSIGTVSNVMNGHPNISASTRALVEDAISKLGYKANRAAKSLPAGRTSLIGYRMPYGQKVNTSMDIFLHQVVESAGDLGLEVLLFTPKPGQTEIEAYTDVLRRGGVDAFVLAGIEYRDERIKHLSGLGVPYAAFGRAEHHQKAVWVDVDGSSGTEQAVDHLVDLGCQKIAYLGWPEGSLTGDERKRGWFKGLEKSGIRPGDNWLFQYEDSFEHGRDLANTLVENGFDAVVCSSDTFALGVMAGLRINGLVPGRDLCVIGFDDVIAGQLVEPGLTSVRQPMEKVAKHLTQRLSRILKQENEVVADTLLVPGLVARGSTLDYKK